MIWFVIGCIYLFGLVPLITMSFFWGWGVVFGLVVTFAEWLIDWGDRRGHKG